MKRCSHCGGRFGLARHWGYYMTRWRSVVVHQFCSEKCKNAFDEERRREIRVSQFLNWLYRPP